jgi:hypothetical protein
LLLRELTAEQRLLVPLLLALATGCVAHRGPSGQLVHRLHEQERERKYEENEQVGIVSPKERTGASRDQATYRCGSQASTQEGSELLLRQSCAKLAHQIETIVGEQARLLKRHTQRGAVKAVENLTRSAALSLPSLAAATSLLGRQLKNWHGPRERYHTC